jgi:hypothetical protein
MRTPYSIKKTIYNPVLSKENPILINPKEIKDTKEYIKIDLIIPVLHGCKNKEIEDHINHSIENDAMEFKRQMEEAAKEYAEEAKRKGEPIDPYIVSTIYRVTYNQNNIISISVIYHEYINGKNYYIKTSYNFDTETGKSLSLKDLFKEGVDYKEVINKEVRKELLYNKDKYMPDAAKKFKGIADDQPFYIDGDNLSIFFGFHQIAPIESEIPIIKIPFSALKDDLKPDLLK